MSRVFPLALTPLCSFPRVSGDEPVDDCEGGCLAEFSPRERG